jgi:hypothetical protein
MPTKSSRKRMSRVEPVILFLYQAGSNDPTDSHQDEKLVMAQTFSEGWSTQLIRWHQPNVPVVGDVYPCSEIIMRNDEKRRIETSGHFSRASFKTPRLPKGLFPEITQTYVHFRQVFHHKPSISFSGPLSSMSAATRARFFSSLGPPLIAVPLPPKTR